MKRYGLFTILFLALSFAAMAQAADSKPTWQREWKKIIEGAKKEGEVRLWGEQEITHPEIRRPISTRRKFFSTGFYRAGQTVWQATMNGKVQEPSDSMRVDIAKDKVGAPAKREEGKKYRVTGFLDPDAPAKLFKELTSREKRK